jgi:hypothetical protein
MAETAAEQAPTPTSVGEDFPRQQQRARELLKAYQDIGPEGYFGVQVIQSALEKADQALASGDVVAILRSYEQLRDLK